MVIDHRMIALRQRLQRVSYSFSKYLKCLLFVQYCSRHRERMNEMKLCLHRIYILEMGHACGSN